MNRLHKNLSILLSEMGNPKRAFNGQDRLRLYQALAETIQAIYHTETGSIQRSSSSPSTAGTSSGRSSERIGVYPDEMRRD